MSVRKQFDSLTKQGLVCFTGFMEEKPHKEANGKPTKNITLPTGYQKFKFGDWTKKNIMGNHNTLILNTGTGNKNIVLIDWDFYEWNNETLEFEMNTAILEQYNMVIEKLGGEVNTFTETTGNNGVHWIYTYDPEKLGFIIKQKTGFVLNGVKCGDIKGENGIVYTAPTNYKDLNGEIKCYEIQNDMPFNPIPDILYEIIPFEAFGVEVKKEKKTKTKQQHTFNDIIDMSEEESGYNSGEQEIIENISNDDFERLADVSQLSTKEDFILLYLHCINKYDDFDVWRDVCFSVSLNKEYHKLVHTWAKQSSKYDYIKTQKTINSGNGKKTIGSLCFMAKEQNLKKYNEIVDKYFYTDNDFKTMIETFNDFNITNYYYKYHKFGIIYDEENSIWYKINNKNIWESSLKCPEYLKNHIITFIIKKLEKYLIIVKDELFVITNELLKLSKLSDNEYKSKKDEENKKKAEVKEALRLKIKAEKEKDKQKAKLEKEKEKQKAKIAKMKETLGVEVVVVEQVEQVEVVEQLIEVEEVEEVEQVEQVENNNTLTEQIEKLQQRGAILNELKNNIQKRYIMDIGKTNFIKGVLDMIKGKYINKHELGILLSQILNKNKLPFENGLYDLDKKEFRNIEYNDFVLNTVGYDYLTEDKRDTPDYINAYKKLEKIFLDIADNTKPEKEEHISDLQYLKNICSSLLYGENKKRKIYIFTGSGSNSKSWLIETLIKPSLGSTFYKSIGAEYFTRPNGRAGQATPELADKAYTRALISSEPEGNDLLQVAKIKNITGSEDINTRQLFGRAFTYKPQFTPILLCNDIPKFNKVDNAISERVVIYPFKRKFVNTPTLSYHRKRNEGLADEILLDDVYKQAFINILISNYNVMNTDKRSLSSVEASENFIDENNPLKDFIGECIKVSEGNVNNQSLYNRYTEWYNKYFTNRVYDPSSPKCLSIKQFIGFMKYNEYETGINRNKNIVWLRIGIIEEHEIPTRVEIDM